LAVEIQRVETRILVRYGQPPLQKEVKKQETKGSSILPNGRVYQNLDVSFRPLGEEDEKQRTPQEMPDQNNNNRQRFEQSGFPN
jgi:hypothetical protein